MIKPKSLAYFLVLLCSFFSLPVFCQEHLTEQYLSIRDKLTNLKKNSEHVTEQLRLVSENLSLSQKEAKQWEEKSKILSESLTSINQQLTDCYKDIEKQKQVITKQRKILNILIIIFIALFIIKVILILLYAKGFKVPRFIDILG